MEGRELLDSGELMLSLAEEGGRWNGRSERFLEAVCVRRISLLELFSRNESIRT